MTRGIQDREPDPEVIYADIFNRPHWRSPTRMPMSLDDRAAQFAPFAALTGYEDMVAEEARWTEEEIELSEGMRDELNEQLAALARALAAGARPAPVITYFDPDPLKPGGQYRTVREKVKQVDPVAGQVILRKTAGYGGSHVTIPMNRILSLSFSEPEETE